MNTQQPASMNMPTYFANTDPYYEQASVTYTRAGPNADSAQYPGYYYYGHFPENHPPWPPYASEQPLYSLPDEHDGTHESDTTLANALHSQQLNTVLLEVPFSMPIYQRPFFYPNSAMVGQCAYPPHPENSQPEQALYAQNGHHAPSQTFTNVCSPHPPKHMYLNSALASHTQPPYMYRDFTSCYGYPTMLSPQVMPQAYPVLPNYAPAHVPAAREVKETVQKHRMHSSSGDFRGRRANPKLGKARQWGEGPVRESSTENEPAKLDEEHGKGNGAATSPPRSKMSLHCGATSESQRQGMRTNFVMWCGNVPSDAMVDELWSFFIGIPDDFGLDNTSAGSSPNATQGSDSSLGLSDPQEPGLVADNAAGIVSIFIISPQRGKGVHVSWYRAQTKAHEQKEVGSASDALSFTSTNSSLLRQPMFEHRFFILKSSSHEALVEALRTNVWRTQPHNEPVLDQAFRNSKRVTLLFSENFSGQFFGHADMASHIGGALPADTALKEKRGIPPDREYGSASAEMHSSDGVDRTSTSSSISGTPSINAERDAKEELAREAKERNLSLENMDRTHIENAGDTHMDTGILPRDISAVTYPSGAPCMPSQNLTPLIHEKTAQIGSPFYITWKNADPLPFADIQSLRNPWRDNRLVKVSRDGTELEPNVGRRLLDLWGPHNTTA
ncbi:hypothetical protein MVES_003551 [Malassezia vespertilionis]|uniref:YTH domain-containing protein n=1 Tax=Malassezia vespertilionis TaxID=2020962 RepID=A0A2N1J841_9BASI|nr:hypothetical protein MVES_003551 [Malassezia vespertilionis]